MACGFVVSLVVVRACGAGSVLRQYGWRSAVVDEAYSPDATGTVVLPLAQMQRGLVVNYTSDGVPMLRPFEYFQHCSCAVQEPEHAVSWVAAVA